MGPPPDGRGNGVEWVLIFVIQTRWGWRLSPALRVIYFASTSPAPTWPTSSTARDANSVPGIVCQLCLRPSARPYLIPCLREGHPADAARHRHPRHHRRHRAVRRPVRHGVGNRRRGPYLRNGNWHSFGIAKGHAMKSERRRFLHLAATAAAFPALSRIAWSQSYPVRPVRVVLGLSPGGSVDLVTGIVAQALSEFRATVHCRKQAGRFR
jgi:hypothetical protein